MTYVDTCGQCERISDAYSEYCDRTAELLREVENERDRYREALETIRDADPVDMALDPGWPARIAAAALPLPRNDQTKEDR